MTRGDMIDAHLSGLAAALLPFRREAERLADWGTELAWTLARGGRILVAGNGGSAAEAQHLTAELVGKLRDDREPLSAIALHAETSALTAISNDYGYHEVFARQVRAHGRTDDILLLLSTSGTSTNLLTAAHTAHETGLRCWAFTGPTPNPLADACHEVLAIDSPESQVVQELHLVATHVLCEYVDQALPLIRQLPTTTVTEPRGTRITGWAPPLVPLLRDGHTASGHTANGQRANGHTANGHRGTGHSVDGHGRNGHHRNGSTGTGWVQR
ncbi:D-sedoheptulose-7-phosphate isomerase [Micromonospora sp. CB01531]|uniref:D-sedoheptulose-7-phosphate isomerase n=1 Tax=Micromonospora sp. CB01531 TaxID=1718947 RepID=UPI0009FA4979|nr:SIS domain-containing protein [Micromonospora sp. CB01531]